MGNASNIATGSKLGIDAMKKLPGEGFKRPWARLMNPCKELMQRSIGE